MSLGGFHFGTLLDLRFMRMMTYPRYVDKFNYLNSVLEGTAALTIQGLSLTTANYDTAIELLKKRFGNTQQIVATHMEELLKLPACIGDHAQPLR